MKTTANPERCSVAPISARMTLMRGTPEEIERDLAAIDQRIKELEEHAQSVRHSRDCWADRAKFMEAALTACHSAMLGKVNPKHPAWGVLFAAQDYSPNADAEPTPKPPTRNP